MRLLIISFNDGVDLSTLPSGTGVAVSDGITTVSGRVLMPAGPIEEPAPELVPHSHPADIGPATPIS